MTLITACPYCGTTYFEARSRCENCGAALPPATPAPAVVNAPSDAPAIFTRSAPPMPPRPVPRGYLTRRLSPDSGFVVGMVFTALGGSFLGIAVSILFSTGSRVLWVFFPLGLVFFTVGLALAVTRLAAARRQAAVLRHGQAALGRIESIHYDRNVEINGRSPLVLHYTFTVMGRPFSGKISTLRNPDPDLHPAAPIYVLYNPDRPEESTLYLDL